MNPSPFKHVAVACLLGLVFLTASAQKMYRCPSAGGGTAFSDTPCAGGAGGEITVKPSIGAAPAAQAKPDPQTRGAMDKRNAEFNALLSPECRRARTAFQAKVQQKGGVEELMKEGNPISKAWEACEFEAKDSINKLNAKDQEIAQAEERKAREQNRIAEQKHTCATQRKTLEERRQRAGQVSEQERAALRTIEQELAANCR
jgi:Domain of unknown function (DUF4124)